MKKEVAEYIVECCQEEGIEAVIYEGYSGRGMYGKQTEGVQVDGSIVDVLTAVLKWLPDTGEAERISSLMVIDGENLRQDSLGKGIIIY